MRSFIMFLLALVALMIVLSSIGPLIMFALGAYLLYVIFKQFVKTESTGGKVFWLILGLIVLSITIPNTFGLIGVVALYFLYTFFRKEKRTKEKATIKTDNEDPFLNFEKEWTELNKL